ncbi:autotransporter outer membrane beta-barrel domain-containing protein [Pluralibacter sp.]|uniref:autotransporter outer membrane beta-barrel domain-containing protein n=1 Tax=Pluralibacter sp. TaxID=1920032 RepID=UPI0025DB25EE|nr:autotransporter outer membrane beta-barrel domain-containing protein [Pluralibacter sp.]MBV8041051.1 autotransporter outer membrane beta-barrel domain-containing protein [Pluralibacter sp.]
MDAIVGGTINLKDVDITTSGQNAIGMFSNGGSITSTDKVIIHTNGNQAYGVYSDAGNINLVDADITTTGDRNFGLAANNNGDVSVSGASTINVSGNQVYGVYGSGGGSINLNDLNVTVDGTTNSMGVYATGNGTAITSSGFSTVYANGSTLYGVSVENGAVVNMNGLDVTTTSDGTVAIVVKDGEFDNSGTTDIHTAGYAGIQISGGTSYLNDLNITNSGDNAIGISTERSGMITISGTTIINQTGGSDYGIIASDGSSINLQDVAITNVTGDYNLGMYASDANTIVSSTGTVNINTAGTENHGIFIVSGATETFNKLEIMSSGDNATGITLSDTDSQINLNDTVISTSGLASHGFQVTSGAGKTFDGSAGNVLPSITVDGAGSALLDASDAGSEIYLNNQQLNINQTIGPDTWGVKAENGGEIHLEGSSDSGGTGLWASGAGSNLVLNGTTDTTGSRVKLDDSSTLTLSRGDNTASIGSLEGEASSTVSSMTADGALSIGVNNTASNGSMIDDANFAGAFTNIGQLIKTGSLTQILSGSGNTVGSVDVNGGTLRFEQSGPFTTTADYRTQTGATTDIGLAGATLIVGGAFTQESGSTLNVTLDSGNDVTADTASLDGVLTVNGFVGGPTPVKSSDVASNTYTVIHTLNGITGDFSNNLASQLDYLLYDGHISTDGKDYNLGFRLAWNEGLQDKSTGGFTLNDGTAFDVDTVLADQTAPTGGFDTGWDGKSLTKAGNGLLVLSAVNTYTGSTTLNAGILRTDVADSIADSSALTINGGVFDLNGNHQLVNNLSGTGGTVVLNGATLTAVNTSSTDNTTYAGDITDGGTPGGGLTKSGNGTLTLSGKTAWTGDTRIDAGGLALDGAAGGAQLVSNIIGADNTTLSLQNGASLTGTVDPTSVSIDTASRWNMTGDSLVNDVNLAGTINFVAPSASPMTDGHTLTTGNWNGQGGTVVLNTVLGDDTSVTDKIVVNGDTRGNTFVKVNNAGGHGAQTVEGIRVVEVTGQSDGTFTKSGRIVAGAYDYSLMQKGPDWYLTSQYIAPAADPAPVIRPEAGSYIANQAAANTMFILRLHDRLGETQYTDALTGEKKVTSLWLRQSGGHNAWKDSTGQLSTQSNRYVTQLGGDIAQWSTDGLQRLHLGVMAGYGNNSSNTHSGVSGYHAEGTVSGYSAGVYATWYQNDETRQGLYLDSWAQYGWFNNEVKGQDTPRESYKSSGLTASLEMGYTHKLGEFTGSQGSLNEWFIQPQAQVVWMGVNADGHQEHNGTRVSAEGEGNLQTRLGIRTYLKGHSKHDAATGRTFQPFVEVNWIHNTQDFGTRMDGVSVHQSGASNIGEIKTGVEGQLTSRLNLWGNVGVQIGDKGYNDTSAMVGVKYAF